MKNRFLQTLAMLVILISSGCIKDELPNVEADIEDILLSVESVESVIISKKIERDRVTVFIFPNSLGDKKDIRPTYVLSNGAKIISGLDSYDYSQPHKITVMSEDGDWNKTYTVRFLDMDIPSEYHFENWQDNKGNYDDCYERIITDESGTIDNLYMWASGNLGFRIAKSGSKPWEYPTFKTLSADDAHTGAYAAVLATRMVGKAGQGSPIAAGNLFIGEFSGKGINIMKEPMRATRFGLPFNKKPKKLSFWFKYNSAGNMYTYDADGNQVSVYYDPVTGDPRDYCAVYAIVFDNKEAARLYKGENYLDGYTILSSPAEVGRAMFTGNEKYGTVGNNYVYKEVDFTWSKSIDPDRLANYEYSIAVVFSSSFYGANFIGAIGSKLWIDDVALECE